MTGHLLLAWGSHAVPFRSHRVRRQLRYPIPIERGALGDAREHWPKRLLSILWPARSGDEVGFRLRVADPIVAELRRELPFKRFVFDSECCVFAQAVAEGKLCAQFFAIGR